MANLVDGIVKSRTVKRLLDNKELLKWSKIVGGVFLLFLFSTLPEYSKRSVSPLSPELRAIDQSIKAAHTKTDPFVRERFIQQEAKRLGLTSDDYRKLFAIRKKDADVLPDAPASLPSKVVWFYQDLSRGQRLQLVKQGGKWLLGVLPNLTILFVGIRFLIEIPQREKQERYQAWLVVHAAYGQKSSGARIWALQDLNEQGASLRRLKLEKEASLSKIQLIGADLYGANLRGAFFWGADLHKANFEKANLIDANFSNANLIDTNFSKANLIGANFFNANLSGAKFSEADLSGAKFSKADLRGADLRGADLREADLRRADLREANLREARVEMTRFSTESGITEETKRDLVGRGAIFNDAPGERSPIPSG